METMRNENLITNTSDSNDEKINNISIDEITIKYILTPCQVTWFIIMTIMFPVLFFYFY